MFSERRKLTEDSVREEQEDKENMQRTLQVAASLVVVVCVLSACAPQGLVVTNGQSGAAQRARTEQEGADEFRRAGEPAAARQAQSRADVYTTAAAKGYDGFLDWLFDALFYAWLDK